MICAALLVLALPCSGEPAADGKTVFMIGNSFTHDSMPYSIPALAAQKSDSLTVGAHIKSGSPVHNIWGSPDAAREVSKDFGKYRDALTKHQWDVVTLQPFYKKPGEGFPQSTMQSDIDSILKFIALARENPANKKTKFYIYESWPFLWTGKPFQQAWDATSTDELTAPTMHTRDYYEHLLKRLRKKTDAEIHVIPVPEVMYQLDRQMQAGKVPGLTGIGDIMKDKLHLDAGLGHYIASVTVYATLFGKNPAGLVKPEGHYDGGNQELLTPQMCEIVNTTVWDVVSKNPSTGVGEPADSKNPAADPALAPEVKGAIAGVRENHAGGANVAQAEKVHLFILSGQSNMVGLNPDASFTPTVTQALAPDKVIVVKNAWDGQPIRRWHKQWKPAKDRKVAGDNTYGDLYDRLMSTVRPAIEGKEPATITFCWMQGEGDAMELHGDVYADSMRGVIQQLRTDLKRSDVKVVIGRLNDCANGKNHWDKVREAQVEVAKTDPLVSWVDTDDLNGPTDDVHFNEAGYTELGKRFALSALGFNKSVSVNPAATKWLERHTEKLAEIESRDKIDLVFIGDSITSGWEQEGKDVWEQYYKKRNALNLGFGGDKTEQVIWRLQNGEGAGYQAKLAVVMIGTNNGGREDSPTDVAAGIKGILDQWHALQPQCKVLLLGIFPRGATSADPRRQVNEKVNALISQYADNKRVFYLDIGSAFLADDGTLAREVMPDLLHVHDKGYGIWAQAIEPTIQKLLDEK